MISQKGGKLIGQGTYGCVYKPAIPCKEGDRLDSDVVSKVMDASEARSELRENLEISKIDKTNKYHLPKPKFCYADKNILERTTGIDKCRPLTEATRPAILQYKYGGEDLSKFISKVKFTPTNIKKFLLNVRPLLVGLCEMKKDFFTHSDIKLANMVINPDTFEMNFIDFGLSQKMVNRKIKNQYIYDVGYFPFPPETFFISSRLTHMDIQRMNPQDDFTLINRRILNIYNDSFSKNIEKKYFVDGSPYTFDAAKYYLPITTENYYDFCIELASSIDTFSLGIVFAIMYCYMGKQKFRYNVKPQLSPLLSAFYDLIKGMLNSFYKERATPEQLISLYDDNIAPLVGLRKPVVQRPVKITAPRVEEPEVEELVEQHKASAKKQAALKKVCPEDKILNPKTNRCVNKTGVLGKKLMNEHGNGAKKTSKPKVIKTKKRIVIKMNKTKKGTTPTKVFKIKVNKTLKNKLVAAKAAKKTRKTPPKKVCPEDKILNPKTNRCVNKTGVLGKKLMKQ